MRLMLGDCLERMKEIEDCSIDMVLTSPPYDNLRTYNDSLEWSEDVWQKVFINLYRVVKKGGVVVWVVNDATINGSETGTSFKQAIFAKSIGFNIHDTMLYIKNHLAFPETNRYYPAFEYMFVFSKGKPDTFNPIMDRKNASAGRDVHGGHRNPDGTMTKKRSGHGNIIKEHGVRWNYWLMNNQSRGLRTEHPATFPDCLAIDHVKSWSNEGDVVLDPFMGSGTTGVACKNLKRKFIGIEKDAKYFKIAEERIKDAGRLV